VDWLWTIPAVGVVFLVLLGIGTSDANLAPRALDARVRYALAVAAVAVAAFLFAPPWISARLDSRALKAGSSDGDLRWARRLDPLSLGPLYAEFRLSHSPSDRIRIAREAVEKEPRWVGTQYLLGIAYLDAGRKAEARRALRKALRLDPHEARTRAALRRAQGRK
jgi:cytochrome c-type biogenesis protein CcmH/NrfG